MQGATHFSIALAFCLARRPGDIRFLSAMKFVAPDQDAQFDNLFPKQYNTIFNFRRNILLKEFKQFALQGNVMDLAVGVIIGSAFGKIVTSFVNDILMPPLGLLLGQVNFTDLYLVIKGQVPASTPLSEAAKISGVVTWNYGSFINAVVDFAIIAFVIFLMIRFINRLKTPVPAPVPAPATKTCPYCATEIPIPAKRCPHCTSQL